MEIGDFLNSGVWRPEGLPDKFAETRRTYVGTSTDDVTRNRAKNELIFWATQGHFRPEKCPGSASSQRTPFLRATHEHLTCALADQEPIPVCLYVLP